MNVVEMISNKYITFENCSVTIMNFTTSGSNNNITFNELGNNSTITNILNNKETDNNESDSSTISDNITSDPNNKRKNDNITEEIEETKTKQSNKKKKIIVNESNNDNYFVNHNCNHVLCNTKLMGWYSTLIEIPTKSCVHSKEEKDYDCYQATLICGSCTLSNNLLHAVWICTLCASPQATAKTQKQKKTIPFVSQEKYVTAHENSYHSMKVQGRCITTEHNTKAVQNNLTIQVLRQEVYDTILFLLLCCTYIGFPQYSQPLVDLQRILNRGTPQPGFGLPLQTTVPIVSPSLNMEAPQRSQSGQTIAGVPIFSFQGYPPDGYKLNLDLQRMAIFNRSPQSVTHQFGLNLQKTEAVPTVSPSLNMETPQTALTQVIFNRSPQSATPQGYQFDLNLQTTEAVPTVSPSLDMETPQTALTQPDLALQNVTLQPPSNENDLIHDQKIKDATVEVQEEDNLFAYDDQEIHDATVKDDLQVSPSLDMETPQDATVEVQEEDNLFAYDDQEIHDATVKDDLQDQNATDQNGPLSHTLSYNSLYGSDLAVHDLDFNCFSSSANTLSRDLTPVDDVISANTPSRGLTPVDDVILFDDLKVDDLKDVPISSWTWSQRDSPLSLGSTQTINPIGYNS